MDVPSSNPEYLTTIFLTGLFLLFMLLEAIFPLRQRKRSWIRRVIINACMSAVAFVVGTFVVRTVSLGLIEWTSEKQFGLLQFLGLPLSLQFVAGFLLMDLTFYYWVFTMSTILIRIWMSRLHSGFISLKSSIQRAFACFRWA